MAERGFAEFYEAHFDPVARALTLAGADRELARDATQEAFARALRRWRRVRDMDRPDGWVYVVAMNQLRDHWRRLERTHPVDAAAFDGNASVVTRLTVRDAIATLPPRQRQAVVLRYLADLPVRDIADAMSCATVTVATVVAVSHRGAGRVEVLANAPKERRSSQLHRIDVVVVPGSVEVQRALEASPLVERYAPLAPGPRADVGTKSLLGPNQDLLRAMCALRDGGGFAVESSQPGPDLRSQLSRALGSTGTVYAITTKIGVDIEVFMKVDASTAQVEAVRNALTADSDVRSFQFLDHEAALAEFQRTFADQPSLLNSVTANELPESFRLRIEPDASQSAIATRYQALSGVDAYGVMNSATNIRSLQPIPTSPGQTSRCS